MQPANSDRTKKKSRKSLQKAGQQWLFFEREENKTYTMSFPAYFLTSDTSTFRLAASSFLRAAPSAAPARRLVLLAPDTMLDAAFFPNIPANTYGR